MYFSFVRSFVVQINLIYILTLRYHQSTLTHIVVKLHLDDVCVCVVRPCSVSVVQNVERRTTAR